jgi:acetyl esterase/lipase
MTLDPGAARLLRMLAANSAANTAAPSAEDRREALLRLAALTADPPDLQVTTQDLVYRRRGPKGPIALRLYRPGEGGDGLIVYLHGGGWVAGDLDTHDGVCRALARHSGCAVLAVDYRRPPEHPYPAALTDALDVMTWARGQARRLGFDPRRLVLAGDSAGANLAAAAAQMLGPRGPALLVLLCPILELEPLHPSRQAFAEGYFVSAAQFARDLADYLPDLGLAHDPPVSPLRAPRLAGHPPTQLHLAEYDPFRDEGLVYAARLTDVGVSVSVHLHPGVIHYFYALPRPIPYAREALARIGQGVKGFMD